MPTCKENMRRFEARKKEHAPLIAKVKAAARAKRGSNTRKLPSIEQPVHDPKASREEQHQARVEKFLFGPKASHHSVGLPQLQKEWTGLIDRFKAAGLSPATAVQQANRENPSLRQRIVSAANR